MSLRLREIRTLDDDNYEVVLAEEGGATERVICHVFEHNGFLRLRTNPSILLSDQPPRIDSREFAEAVLAYHRRQHEGSESD